MPDIRRINEPDISAGRVTPLRILLTGATGFVGSHLQVALAAAYPEAKLLTSSADLRDEGALTADIASGRPDVCVHLAAIATSAKVRQDEQRAWDVNLHGSLRLAHAILRHVPNCQMVYASSADAYGGGNVSNAPIDEGVPLAPRNLYAATKAGADLALGAMVVQGLRLVRLRPFNHTGAGQSAELVIAAFAHQIALIAAGRKPPLLEVGNLDAWRDFLDVRDVCAAYIACIDRRDRLPPGSIINIGSGQARRIGDVLTELMTIAGVSPEVRMVASRVRESDTARAVANISKARMLLGWAPTIPWVQTLSDVLNDWRTRLHTGPAHQ